MDNKKLLRKKMSAVNGDFTLIDDMIMQALIETEHYKHAKNIFIYYSVLNEVNTHKIISHALENKKMVYIPRCVGDYMELVSIKRIEDISSVDKWGIPTASHPAQNVCIDLAVIPAVCFDKNKYRLGRGKGYYDRFLKDYNGISIGLTRFDSLQDRVPTETHDIPVDYIVTERGCF